MEIILEFIFGSANNPIEMAACFMLFLCLVDALFSTINTMILGVMKK